MKIIAKDNFKQITQEFLGDLTEEVLSKLWDYYCLIELENQKYNLTGFYNETLVKEGIIESILIFKEINNKIINLQNKKVLDIGSGAGFPIIPYLIFNPNFNLVIYEPMDKRVNFLNLVIEKCQLKNVVIKKQRAEESKDYEKFDFISARAVSELKNLVEISHKLSKINGTFCFLKSNNFEREIENAKYISKLLKIDFNIIEIGKFFNINNVLIYYKKSIQTPDGIPRKWSTIIKNNLKK
ncbi:16S rRNA (guanine(527)-N(7))-methyltransferase RsmG [Metamycoplasma phocicerebrale]|uniref:Ribosomal RNA small subunit methyltransferase G n=1 Tax=Metamycoplasma phocicerebrale TaxID=142649 RepID=A0A3Q9VAC1_9BACT|nr:16S rRNA (guanine(527)-N(7))-methyltransferase RsmG [Metamycoplasma phocicerebrale]AZZ65639.1 16S rRNA (guanine(527)-N(7))-methyltransferase RsmG [Metamycoplasma phocicerebrale]